MSDFEVLTVDYSAPDAAETFVRSLHNTGFGVLKNHPIPKETVEKVYKNWKKFFDQDDETKNAFLFDKAKQDGFFPQKLAEKAKGSSLQDIKEYYHVYPWGRKPEELDEEIMEYYKLAQDLATELLAWIEKYSPPEVTAKYTQPLPDMIKDSSQTLLRVLHYPPLTGNEHVGAVRAAAHGDINLITILPAATEPGLQVLSNTGEWLDVPQDFGYLIVNIGDMLQEASGGYFPSTIHRVINPEGNDTTKSRISLPLFLHPRPDVVLSDKYTADSYLKERLKELGVI